VTRHRQRCCNRLLHRLFGRLVGLMSLRPVVIVE
jgi:hypothetical protein